MNFTNLGGKVFFLPNSTYMWLAKSLPLGGMEPVVTVFEQL